MSLYYGRSPYLQQNKKRSPFKRGGGVRYGSAARRAKKINWNVFGKRVSRNLSMSVVKTGAVVKEGTVAFAQAVKVAKNIKSGTFSFEIGSSSVIFGLVIVAVSLSMIYLGHFNAVATKGYELRRLEADRQQLMTQYDIKNMKLAKAKALATIIESDRAGSMRRTTNIEYVKGHTAIASR